MKWNLVFFIKNDRGIIDLRKSQENFEHSSWPVTLTVMVKRINQHLYHYRLEQQELTKIQFQYFILIGWQTQWNEKAQQRKSCFHCEH